jgi:hypothetical protein
MKAIRRTVTASFGTDQATGQPITTCEWIDRLAPRAWAVIAAGTCSTYGGVQAMESNPTGCMGLPDYLGWQWRSKAGIPMVCVPGCPVQPDNSWRRCCIYSIWLRGRAPMIPLDEALRHTWLFGRTLHEGLRSRRLLRAGAVRGRVWIAALHREARMLGTGGAVQCGQAGLDGGRWRMPPTSAASALDARCRDFQTSLCRSWISRPALCCLPPPFRPTGGLFMRCGGLRRLR